MSTSTLQINKTKYRNFKIAAAGSTAALVLGGMAFLQPFSFSNNSYADSSNTDISINIGETIMLPELSQEAINLSLEPNVDGDFTSASIDVRMSTNHVSGYTLTMSTEGAETALTSEDFDNYKIDALNSKTSATDFANLSSTASINKWGYATDNNGDGEGQTETNYYYGITNKDNPTTIKITDGPTNSSETNVTFATKGKDLAAGTYSNTVVFSAVGNAILYPIKDGMDMQSVTSSMCADTPDYDGTTSTEFTLKDNRDNNEYIVRKLADGNCWMTQNLRLTGNSLTAAGHSTTLKAEDNDTDLDSGSFEIPNSATWGGHSVAGSHLIAAADAPIGTIDGPKASSDLAYARGTYYTWPTAVLNANEIGTSSPQTNSICPKNWNLPNSDGSTVASTNQFYNLYNKYSGNYVDFLSAYDYYYSQDSTKVDYYLAGSWHSSEYVDDSGTGGNWWSNTSHSSNTNQAWYLYITTSGIGKGAHNWYRYFGFSVRCVLSSS